MTTRTSLDRYLVTPRQLERLRGQGGGRGALPEMLLFLLVIALCFAAETAIQSLCYPAVNGLGSRFPEWYQAQYGDAIDPMFQYGGVPLWLQEFLALISTAGAVPVILLCLRFASRRPVSAAGLEKPFWKEYGMGMFLGAAMLSLSVGIALLGGGTVTAGTGATRKMLLIFMGYCVQGFSEELMFRGYLMTALARKNSVWVSILCSAAMFSAMHLLNFGISAQALGNLFLFGVFAGLYFLWRGNLWGAAALHTAWNFTQGNLFGVCVSGNTPSVSLLQTRFPPQQAWLNGGDFGPEGGAAVTLVLILGIAAVFALNLERIRRTPECI